MLPFLLHLFYTTERTTCKTPRVVVVRPTGLAAAIVLRARVMR
jgi:hypothetical protein